MYLAAAFLLFLALGRSSAAPSCSAGGMMSCIMPMLGYMMGPEGHQMAQTTNPMDYTEEQVTGYCRLGRGALKCFYDYYDRCLPSMPDFRDFFGNTAALMKGCEQPGFYNKARILFQCTTTLNQTRGKTNACYNVAIKMTMEEMQKLRPTPSPWTGQYDLADMSRQFSSGQILDAMCCNTKFYQTCSGTEITDKCGQDAQQVFDDLNKAILNGYDCSEERLKRCPPQAVPAPEDYGYQNQMDLTKMLAGSSFSLG